MRLTQSERATYQALVARGVSHEDALEDALDGVSVEEARKYGIKPEVIRCVIEPTGKYFVADPRQYEKDESPWYCIHNGTVAKTRGQHNVDQMLLRTAYWPDPARHPIFIFEARNATQVRDELESRGYITNHNGYRRSSINMNAIERRKRQAEAAIQRAQAELDRLYRLPDEPVVEDDAPNVIYFQKRFSPNSRLYDYAAIKASDGLWYTTGPQSPKGYTWDRLVEWMFDGHEDLTIYTTKKFRPLS
jgi:hypothetical protein